MRKVQPFRVDYTVLPKKTNASFEEWLTDGWLCSKFEESAYQETHAEAPKPNLPITGNVIDVTW